MKKNYLFLIILFIIFISKSYSQTSYGGTPPSFSIKSLPTNFDIREFQKLDMEKIKAQDDSDAMKGVMYKVGRSIPINLNMENSGTWSSLPDGRNLWRLTIKSADAKAIAVYYNKFHLPKGSQLFLYDKTKIQVIGAFNELTNPESDYFSTELIHGDQVTLEYVSPLNSTDKPEINISEISYVYRGVDHLFKRYEKSTGWGQSDPCEVNVNCSEGATWQNQKRGVAEIFLTSPSGQGWCSGSLINNTANDCKPYFLTAFHCWESSTVAQMHQWQFYFNFEATTCTTPATSPTYSSMIGCTQIADGDINGGSDFFLVLLDNPVPVAINPYYNGWDANTTASASGVSIHHPAGDIKKISTYTAALTSSTYISGVSGATNGHWQVVWAATANGHGVTEGGSSGSPIFNSSGLIVGTLTGGGSYCTALTTPDDYGKMSYHWTSNGATSANQLKPWLDPGNSGVLTLTGKNNCFASTLTANFSGTPTTLAVGQSCTFTDLSTGGPTTWTWTFTGGTPATYSGQTPPAIVYNTVGVYPVKLKITQGSLADSLTKTGYITVNAVVIVANFSGTPTTLTAGQSCTFTDLSTGGPTSWNWTFSGGTPANYFGKTPPAIVYSTAGIYPVKLKISKGITSDSLTINNYITVKAPVIADFSGTPTTVNVGSTVTFTDLSTGNPTTWNWTFDQGSPGSYVGQTPPAITYNTIGTYDVTLKVTDGSTTNTDTETKTHYIKVVDPNAVDADFVGTPTTVLQGYTVNFTDLSTGSPTQWLWTFKSGTPSSSTQQNPVNIKYNSPGTYNVTLKVTKPNYSDIETKVGYIQVLDTTNLPRADFSANYTTVMVGGNVDFYDQSVNMSTGFTPLTWSWTFTGGVPATSNLQDPTGISYTAVGVYPVKLVISNIIGTDSITKITYIHVINSSYYDTVHVDFTAYKRLLTTGETIDFYDLSTGYPDTWSWTFENGSPATSTVQNPQNILYNVPGLWKVSLTASNSITLDSLTKDKYIVVTDGLWHFENGYCDTTSNVSVNEIPQTFRHLPYVSPTKWGGYFPGHNEYKVKMYADKYTNYTISNIHVLNVPVVKAIESPNSLSTKRYVNFHIWTVGADGMPDSILGTVKRYINTFTPNQYNPVQFATPVPVNGNFFIGYEIFYPATGSSYSMDTFVVNMGPNRGNGGLNTIYVNKGTSVIPKAWMTPSVLLGEILNTSLGIEIIGCLVGVDDIDIDKNIKIYPNPANDFVNVEIDDIDIKNIDIKIYDILGKCIDAPGNKINSNHFVFNLSSKPEGIYIINIKINNSVIVRKISLMR